MNFTAKRGLVAVFCHLYPQSKLKLIFEKKQLVFMENSLALRLE